MSQWKKLLEPQALPLKEPTHRLTYSDSFPQKCGTQKHRVPNKMDAKRPTPRHIIIKMPRVKDIERISKAEREKQLVTYREFP